MTSRFEVTRLHKKLICLMGETNFSTLGRTSMLKKLTGGDLIGFEYKGSKHFEDVNYSKIIISTNSLPDTDDKTMGFYRRWLIIDFPNEFSEEKDILTEIPDEEYESLALKCTGILHDLLKKRKFYNEGTVYDRIKKYEEKSDFTKRFIKDFTEESFDGYITKSDFSKKFNSWCKEKKHRELSPNSISRKLKELGIEAGKKYLGWLFDGKGGDVRAWLGIKWKD
jgi:putative DNA primase/helicase